LVDFIQQSTGGNMSEDGFELLDEIDSFVEQYQREMAQCYREIDYYLWKNLYKGYTITPYSGLIFITNKTKTKKEQLKWLKKYSEVLRTYGIDAKVYDDGDEPYICI
jgi:tRNA A37 N6-isopentenylltransferase MiaA